MTKVKRDELVWIGDAESAFGVKEVTLRKWIASYGIQRYRVPGEGKKTFVRKADVLAARAEPYPVGPPAGIDEDDGGAIQ